MAPGDMDVYRVVVTGSRDWADVAALKAVMDEIRDTRPGERLVLRHGMCDPRHPARPRAPIPWHVALKLAVTDQGQLAGADWLADWLARQDPAWVTEYFPADWKRYGLRAGFVRNRVMFEDGQRVDVCVAAGNLCVKPGCRRGRPGHVSHGTASAAGIAKKRGVPVRWVSPAGTAKVL